VLLHEEGATAGLDEVTADLAVQLLSAMSALRRALKREAGAVAEVAGLTNAQVQVVRVVHRRPGVSVAEVADELGVAPNTVSTLVHVLAGAGVLERRSGPPDRRVARLFLCPPVAEGLGAWVGRRSGALVAAMGALSGRDQQALREVLPLLSRLASAVGGASPVGGRSSGVGGKGEPS